MNNEVARSAKFEFKVENVSNLQLLSKKIFFLKLYCVNGNTWEVIVRKNVALNGHTYLAVMLQHRANTPDNWVIVANAIFKLVSSKLYLKPLKRSLGPTVFTPKHYSWGFSTLILLKDLMDEKNGYVIKDTCTFEIEIESGPLQDITKGVCIIADFRKCSDYCWYGEFRLKVDLTHNFLGISSPEFMLNGFPWQIYVLKYYDDNPEESVLQLSLDNVLGTKKTWRCLANITVKLSSFDPEIESVEKEMQMLFTSGYHPKGYHSLDVIEWSAFVDPNKKFIENNSCAIEVKIEISEAEGFLTNIQQQTEGNKHVCIKMECSICLLSLLDKSVLVTRCGHMFCKECIEEWIGEKEACPVCTAKATLDELLPVFLPIK